MNRIGIIGGAVLLSAAAIAIAAQAPITGNRAAAAKPFRATAIATFDRPWAADAFAIRAAFSLLAPSSRSAS